ncbi:MAG: CoA-binding protein [Neomegalonema sp.]|nr:CoA-binding protein [Neomegalonema sp.]
MSLDHSDESYSPQLIRGVLERTKTIAMVGISGNPVKASNFVARYLESKQYCVIPINPSRKGTELFGRTVLGSLAEIPAAQDPVQMVDIFRNSEAAGEIVDEALEVLLDRGLETIWMQIGVFNPQAAERARAKGITVIMNRCPKIEYARHFGELRWGGFNTGVISSKLR